MPEEKGAHRRLLAKLSQPNWETRLRVAWITVANASESESTPGGGAIPMPIVNVSQGPNVIITHPDLVNLYGCRIGAGSRIGPFVEIQKNSHIGAHCKISSHSFICEGVTIEDNVFIGHGVMFTNGLFPHATNADGTLQTESDWELTQTLVGQGASIGSNATIVAGVVIGRGALIGAGAVVTRDVPEHALCVGVPGRIIGDTRHREKMRNTPRHNYAVSSSTECA
jgi:UDP-2-acetamido-3-amino-2,3-dideoxy-glucuronate N-acetyltransferase